MILDTCIRTFTVPEPSLNNPPLLNSLTPTSLTISPSLSEDGTGTRGSIPLRHEPKKKSCILHRVSPMPEHAMGFHVGTPML